MTPARQPQQEYIITESDCIIMEGWGKFPKYWIKYLRSRPHTSPPAPSCQTCVDEMAIFCQGCPNLIAHLNGEIKKNVAEHDAQVAKAAREQVLDEFMMAIEYRFEDTNNGRGVVGTIRGLKESLRAQQQEPQQ